MVVKRGPRLHDHLDRGMTLVEVVVGMTLMAVVFGSLAAFLVTAVSATRTNELRVKATQYGQDRIETARAVQWDDAGFYADDSGYRSSHDGRATVTLGPDRPAGSNAPLPVDTRTMAGVEYSSRMDIVWVDESADGQGGADSDGTNDVKRIHVTVTWTDKGTERSVTMTGDRAPTAEEVVPRGQGAASPYAVTAFTATPDEVTLDAAGGTTEAVTLRVTMSAATSQVRLSWVDRDMVTRSVLMSIDGGTTRWIHTLPAGTGPFDVGRRSFTVRAYGAADTTADSQVRVTMSTSSAGLDLAQPVADPSAPDITASGALTNQLRVSATATAPVTSMSLRYTNRAGSTVTVPMSLSADSRTGSYEFAAGSCCFPDGSDQFTVTAVGEGTAARSTVVTFTPPQVAQVSILEATLSPQACIARTGNPRPLVRSSTLSVRVDNLTSADTVRVQLNDSSGVTHTLDYASSNGTEATFAKTFAAGSLGWDANSRRSVVVSAFAYRGTDVVATSANLGPTPTATIAEESQQGECP